MPRLFSRTRPAPLAAIGALLLAISALALIPAPKPARALSIAQLQREIGSRRSAAFGLASTVAAASTRLQQLDGGILALRRRLAAVQADLQAKRAALLALRARLRAARQRLERLEAREAYAESVLRRQLISTYETGQPDLVTVVLEARGFQELLNSLSFAQRIQHQDVQVIQAVRGARRAVAAQAISLGRLQVREQALMTAVLRDRDSLVAAAAVLRGQRDAVARLRDVRAHQLEGIRTQLTALQRQLSAAQAQAAAQAAARARAAAQAQAAKSAQAAAAQQSAAPAAGGPPSAQGTPAPPVSSPPRSAAGFTFPLPIGSAAPPATWSEDQGVDISAPGNTPEFAVCSGTIVLHGIGGFGPWAPVLHCDTPIDGYSYVYYGHAGPANQLPVGTHVEAGQVMSSIGPGIVGISTGPHLEIGFADSSGSPIGGGSAATMMALLHASY